MSDQPAPLFDENDNKVCHSMSDMVMREYESVRSPEDNCISRDCRTVFKSGKVDIKQGHVKRAYSSCTLLLNSTSSVQLMPQCYPHQSVALDGNIEDKSGDIFPLQAVDLHELNLVEFIEKCATTKQLTWSCRLSLIKQLMSAIQHCHNLARPLGKIEAECISISCDGHNRPFIWDDVAPRSTKSDNIKSLGEIVYFILSDGDKYTGNFNRQNFLDCFRQDFAEQFAAISSTEPVETACDFVTCAIEGSVTIDEMMAHPIFWSDDEKAAFISDLYNSMGGSSDSFKNVDSSLGSEVFGANWTDKLQLSPAEKTILEKRKFKVNKNIFFEKTQGNRIEITDYVIDGNKLVAVKTEEANEKIWKRLKVLAQKSKENFGFCETMLEENKWMNDVSHCVVLEHVLYKKSDYGPAFDGKSLYDLVRFLRNRKAHCNENIKPKKNSQESDYYEALNGYWNFYSARYPKLLIKLYNNRQQFPFYGECGVTSP